MNTNNIGFSICGGIKCGMCDYRDESVSSSAYPNWINVPCPVCGANLLTEADLSDYENLVKIGEMEADAKEFIVFLDLLNAIAETPSSPSETCSEDGLKRKNIEVASWGGLKCDSCDYKDLSIPFEDYSNWIDAPCPVCGANLLTKADFDTINVLKFQIDLINTIEYPDAHLQQRARFWVEFDGSGTPKFTMRDCEL